MVSGLALAFGFLTTVVPAPAASKEKVLYSFCPKSHCEDGATPYAGLIFDTAGHAYGTTLYGGTQSRGTVFQLSLSSDGTWAETVVYSFAAGNDGFNPLAGLTLDANGNLYGTTWQGGAFGGGTVFQITPSGKGKWTERVLHSFGSGKDGWSLSAGVIFDASGSLYGTTNEGGIFDAGTIFRLTPGSHGQWTETLLFSFGSVNGTNAVSAVALDAAGNLYGTTALGGPSTCGSTSCGTVFELKHSGNSQWTEKVLHSFDGKDGATPGAGVVFDAAGKLYGTTFGGGGVGCNPPSGCGTVFELSSGSNGRWTERVLRSFYRNPKDLTAGLILDGGSLYGTTPEGGGSGCQFGTGCGRVFKLTPGAKGKWTYEVLHTFQENQRDGNIPFAGLTSDAAGNLYGTTAYGGAYGEGTVFEVTQ